MSLTGQSTGINVLRKKFDVDNKKVPVIALAGNPNTGKSTVFNNLTGLKQHTGNWPGKTVTLATGYYNYKKQKFNIIDLPGTYSLLVNSTEEKIARDFICFAKPVVTVVVADATNLERNLNLVLQITEITNNVILCLNMIDEAKRKGIKIDITGLENDLQIPVVPTVAREGKGLMELKSVINSVVTEEIVISPTTIEYSSKIREAITDILAKLESIRGNFDDFINLNWLALRILEGDKTIIDSIDKYFFQNTEEINYLKQKGQVKVDGII